MKELFLPRVVWLETEDFEQARVISKTNFSKAKEISQWQIYLNTLALRGFQRYLKERNPTITISQDSQNQAFDNISYLIIDGFTFCLIILDDLAYELMPILTKLITSPQKAAHYYVWLEILEEEEQLNIHGFLRHDELSKLFQNFQGRDLESLSSDSYQLPLSLFDTELNNLLLYTRFLSLSAIKLIPVMTPRTVLVNLRESWNGIF